MSFTDTDNTDRKQGDGVTALHTYTMPVFDVSHIALYIVERADESNTVLKDQGAGPGEYAITVDNNFGGFSVTLGATLAAATTNLFDILVIRTVPYTQPDNIPLQGVFPSNTVEFGLDKLAMMVQQVKEIVDRKIGFAVGSSVTGFSLPTPVANTTIIVNAAGTDYESGPTAAAITAAEAEGVAAAASAADAVVSAAAADASDTAAAVSAAAAAASASGVNLPSITATDTGKLLAVNAAGTAHELLPDATLNQILLGQGADTTPAWGAILASMMPVGSVVQVVSNTAVGGGESANSTTKVQFTAMALSITPSNNTNKVEVNMSTAVRCAVSGSSAVEFAYEVRRNGVAVFTQSAAFGTHNENTGTQVSIFPINVNFLDEPDLAGAVAYTLWVWEVSGSGGATHTGAKFTASTVLKEIVAA